MPRRLPPVYVEPPMPVWWDRFIILATLGAVFLIIYWEVIDVSPAIDDVLTVLDLSLCALFIGDFAARFARARRFRWRFAARNWIDLLGAIPFYGPLRALRIVRVFRVIRLAALGRRMIRRYNLPLLPTATFAYLLIVVACVWVVAAAIFFELEEATNEAIDSFDDALWWSMTTLSTVGYGDLYPTTTGGRAVAMVTMVVGVGILGTLAATIAAAFVEIRERGLLGLGRTRMRDHLLLLGWNDHSERALAEIRRDPRHQARRVLIVADLDRGPVDGVDFVRGEPSQAEVLERASAPHAAAALIFARDPNDPRSDHETALCALSLRRLNPDAKVAAELVSPTNTTHLENAGCDSIIDGAALVADLLVRSVNETGFDRVVDRIVHPTGAATLFQLEGARFAGKGWREVAAALLDEGLTLLAISRGRGSYEMAAEATEPLHADDVLYVFGREPK